MNTKSKLPPKFFKLALGCALVGSTWTAAAQSGPVGSAAQLQVIPLAISVRGDTLATNQSLAPDQALRSGNGGFTLVLQTDGNVVLYNANQAALWSTDTQGKGGKKLVLQSDGNLVLYSASGSAVWSSNTVKSGAVRLILQSDGNLVMRNASGASVWATGTNGGDSGGGSGGSGPVRFTSKGGVNKNTSTASVSTPARSGDYEIVAVGGSSVQGGDEKPIDASLMTGQGFKLVGVRGTADKKSELWIRRNSGQSSVKITGKGKDIGWSLTTIDGTKTRLDISSFAVATYSGGHGEGTADATFKTPSGSGLLIGAFFFDDSVELLSAGDGTILHKDWGFGDGDGVATVLFQPGVSAPSKVRVKEREACCEGGEEFVSVAARFNVSAVSSLSVSMAMHDQAQEVPSAAPEGAVPNMGALATEASPSVRASALAPMAAGSPFLAVNESLTPNTSLKSANGNYRLTLQSDGNVVLYDSASKALWATNTEGKKGVRLVLQTDGNLVLYTSAGSAVWSSKTEGSGATRLLVKDDGNMVLQTSASATVWTTNTGSGGGSGSARVAFVGDSGYGSNFQSVLNLIKSEGAGMTMFLGDTSYSGSNDDAWDAKVRGTLGSSDPVVIAIGNHDVDDSNLADVVSYGKARLSRQSAVSCSGTYGQKMTCRYKNLYFVVSSVGTTGSNSENESFIANSLNAAPAGAWRICAWHKNQRKMQVGGKTDEVGWTAYETCRQKGAFIATGHEHSYSRTHLLSSMSSQTVSSTSSTFTVSPGKTFVFVSGLGGIGIRDQELSGSHWAKAYTANQGATYGVLFGDFYDDRAEFYFKNIKGAVIDRFTVKKGY
jgi:hypothetical protein